ncbi:MAG TPA: PKD domain-containing protein [Methanoregulaceae archaeon]|nr:PKD domain-containing protein [Methanoregulaceae archaeon]
MSVLTVQFTDESPGSGPLTYEWDMNNDGSMDSEEQNPSMDFNEGTYSVKMTVMGPGGSDEEIQYDYITVFLVLPLPGYSTPPTDPDSDGTYEDLNGNGETDFNDVQLLFRWMDWIQDNEPVSLFDLNNNNEIDFNDVQLLFREV